MKVIHDTTRFYADRPSAVTLGKFDGLHRGHRRLLDQLQRLQQQGYYGIVFTIAPEDRPVLLTAEEKIHALEACGISCMLRCPYVPEVLSMEPEIFVTDVLCRGLQAKHIVVGTDFRFGHHRGGDVKLLEEMQESCGYSLHVMKKECHEGREISSTFVREALSQARMELVQELLGSPYPVEGEICHGHQIGRTIGIPTINLIPPENKLLPPYGVYYSDVLIAGRRYQGMTNIGCKPTVDGSFPGVETYLYGVHEDLYGCHARVLLRSFRRPEQKFASLEELQAQMMRDIRAGEEYFRVK